VRILAAAMRPNARSGHPAPEARGAPGPPRAREPYRPRRLAL